MNFPATGVYPCEMDYAKRGVTISLCAMMAALPAQTLSYDADDQLTSDSYDANRNTLAAPRMVARAFPVTKIFASISFFFYSLPKTWFGIATSFAILSPKGRNHPCRFELELEANRANARLSTGPARKKANPAECSQAMALPLCKSAWRGPE